MIVWRVRRDGFPRLFVMMLRRLSRPAWFAGIILWGAGCIMVALPTPTPAATVMPQSSADWQQIAPGIEQRSYSPAWLARLTVLRIDPAQVTIQSHYSPQAPRTVMQWRNAYPDAAILINTNFFDSADEITGMLIADGVRYGESYRNRGGTFYMQNDVPGMFSHLVRQYQGEAYDQAVQAFPMLITDGARSYFDQRPDRATRRTVIGLDSQGRVVILVTTFGGITLLDLAIYLAESDLQLVNALNLDGGGSSLLSVRAGTQDTAFTSFDPVPSVLAVYPR